MIVTPSPLQHAPYAADPAISRGRRVAEARSATRSDFQRDRDRIIHSTAFRRLALKTQVFLPEAGDHFRTRLTHTVEVAQIARTIARALRLDEDLTEALALAHDFGHTPFGHTGEEALDAAMAAFGGFDHNAQTLRVVTLLERRYPAFDGLNLTWETLDGLVNRGPDPALRAAARTPWHRGDLPCFGAADAWSESLARCAQAGAEAQVAAVADDIAYNAHDMEDGLQAGLFGLDDLDAVPLLGRLRADAPEGDDTLRVRFVARELVGLFVEDAVAESRSRIAAARPDTADAVRASAEPLVALSGPMRAASDAVKSFLFAHLYRHPQLTAIRRHAHAIVRDLAGRFLEEPVLLPPTWRQGLDRAPDGVVARRVADYVAGMTDRLAVAEHRRLFDQTPDLG